MTDWRSIPEAAAILVDMAANPPKQRTMPYEGLTRCHKTLFVGKRVQRLTAIFKEEAARILVGCDEFGDHAAFIAHCDLDPQTAIRDIIKSAERFRALASQQRKDAA